MSKSAVTVLLPILVVLLLPLVALAQIETPTTYGGLVNLIIRFINILIPAMFALVFVWLIWRITDAWVLHAGDPAKREEGRRLAVTAVVVMVIALSVWGIVQIIRFSFLPPRTLSLLLETIQPAILIV